MAKISGFIIVSLLLHAALTWLLIKPNTLPESMVYEVSLQPVNPRGNSKAKSLDHKVLPGAKKKTTETESPLPEQKANAIANESTSEAIYSADSVDVPPRLIHQVKATFPMKARDDLKEGHVLLKLVVAADGSPSNIQIEKSSDEVFNHSALESAGQLRFSPGIKSGEPVAVQVQYRVHFELK